MSRRLKSLTAPWKPTGGRASEDEAGVGGTLAMAGILRKACATKCRTRNQRDATREPRWLPPDLCNGPVTLQPPPCTNTHKKAGASYRAPAGNAKLEECG